MVDFIPAVGQADPRGQPACAAVSPRGGGGWDAGEEAVFNDSKALSVQYKRMTATISKCICILHTSHTMHKHIDLQKLFNVLVQALLQYDDN